VTVGTIAGPRRWAGPQERVRACAQAKFGASPIARHPPSARCSQHAYTPQALATLTLRYVQGSAKFQQLPPAQQKLVTALANQAIAQLAKISPDLTPPQLAALITAYKQVVAVLQAQGWLTTAQAGTLDSLASTVQA